MQFRTGSIVCAALLGSCSLALDADKTQCSSDAQCGTFDGKPIYTCTNNFCEPISCNTDAECSARGSFICESNACAQAQCVKDADCPNDGDLCTQGRCGDPVFGCFMQKQALRSDEAAQVQVKILVYGEQRPVQKLKVQVCGAADLACNTPIRANTVYDDAGLLSITGLENGARYGLRFSGEDSMGQALLDAEYYMQRPVVGLSPEADKLEMFPEGLAYLLAGSANVTWNNAEGLVLAQTFGCDMKPLAGVSLADNRAGSLFYLTGVPNPNATETDNMGVGGFVNMEVGTGGNALQHKLTFSYGGDAMFAFTVAPRPRTVTFIQIYMGDYGSTIDRRENVPGRR